MFAYFRISIAGAPPQTVVFQLHPDKCPKTCDNFIALCQSPGKAKRPTSSGSANNDAQPATYRGTEFHRILPGFMIQGGDFTKFDGTGGHAAPTTNGGQPTFPDENFDISHDREGVLAMANRGKNTNGSQFFITLGKTLHLDGKHVAFGHVVRGVEVVREASRVETEGSNGKPSLLQRVVITDCGLGTGDDDGASSSSSSSSSDSSSRRKRSSSRKKKKHRRRDKRRDGDDGSYHKGRKIPRDRSSHSKKNRRRHDKDDHKKKKRRDKASHRHRSREYSSTSDEDNKHRHSSKKRQKRDH